MSPLVLSLAAGRAAIGAFTWVAPQSAARLFGLEPDPKSSYVARLFGVRDVALAIGAVTTEGEARRSWLALGLFCDAFDFLAAGFAHRDGSMRPQAAMLAGGAAAAGAALGAAALARES
ncbi:MAG: hypothetical protein ACXVFN_05455 [Solirubrobacteraceae bacterium]